MNDWLNLEDKVYIVTGGSSGIGAAIVKELLGHGAKVVDADLNEPKEANENLTFCHTDVTNRKDVETTVESTISELGRIDGVVNNAGINLPRLLVDDKKPESQYEMTEQDWAKMFAVNVKSVMLMSQAVGRHLVSQKHGVIVNMSSEAGLEGSQGQSIYSATKGAINGFTRSWAKELGKFNVRVAGVAPGIMEATGLRTPSYENALAYTRNITVDQLRAGYKSTTTTPMGRSGHLYEVADLVSYLLSERASYITGVTINVAGGKSRG
ncbi:SDR family oxidoreductase [Lactobacillus kefiranofaciens]|uniref:D-sorbitol 6-phosphate 2-dehydrogenase n=1 Tax=Lactobacillus kefiranofaciens TaxID=267818 RepID=A0AAX3UC78_9LACO|nr:SDR family oxidoreductase [Lactobacillus kefiranofaciens]AEG41301.1 Short chain dehydrogenase/reductase family protein [Lactobacillus kefiranofaciens subsp. kefiranofaciens]KRM21612.1 short chain dehydrogenase reductase [Lactobacillus kefiranofaciens subsp. kefiranofaciens DSM 5016 = JCM 6985]MDF4142881.1 SDR family oxidoreductase [Lactobacillus kefiranofaciens]QFQ68773.1 SDR family oxidoreductase [Lactobacillus kefiranofaciens subsp. kefiranofaciens]URW70968.1 SDR family oxidoreductase [La